MDNKIGDTQDQTGEQQKKRPEISASFARPITGTVIEQIFFVSKNIGYMKLYPAIFDLETTSFQLKVTRSHLIPGPPMITIILCNPSDQTAVFILDTEKRKLLGHYRAYSLSEQELVALEKLMNDLGIN